MGGGSSPYVHIGFVVLFLLANQSRQDIQVADNQHSIYYTTMIITLTDILVEWRILDVLYIYLLVLKYCVQMCRVTKRKCHRVK